MRKLAPARKASIMFSCRCLIFFVLTVIIPVMAQKHAITFDEMWSMRRLTDLALSPDGQWTAFTVIQSDPLNNQTESDIFLLRTMGGNPRQLSTYKGFDGKPAWSPDGNLVAFLSDRSGSRQIHLIDPHGGEAHQISHLDRDIHNFKWSPDGSHLAMIVDIEADSISTHFHNIAGTRAKIIDKLTYWHGYKRKSGQRQAIWIMPLDGNGVWDVCTGTSYTPPKLKGNSHNFTFSPDGKTITFTGKADTLTDLSIDNNIFATPVTGGPIRCMTKNPADDGCPTYSPDGRFMAWRATRKTNYEADQYDLILRNLESGEQRNMTELFDLDILEITWNSTSHFIYFTASDVGRRVIYSLNIESGKIKGLIHQGVNRHIAVTPDDASILFIRNTISRPWELIKTEITGDDNTMQLSYLNQELINNIEMNTVEDFWFPSFDNRVVHGMLVKPPFFKDTKHYPMLLLIHNETHGAWEDSFNRHWNASMFASQGIAVMMINIRGSKGYGQDFCDAIIKHWGDRPYKDLMAGVEFALEKYPFLDKNRMAAAGSSYGAYMINWIATQANDFKCLVSHSGIFDPVSFYGSTDALNFLEREFDGTPYTNLRNYQRWSPLKKAASMKTPMLLIHGALDSNIPPGQSVQLFTALQRQSIPGRLLYFPDEGQYIKKAANARLWYDTIFKWIKQWTTPKETDQVKTSLRPL
ncbi:S9 family peptidase [bacterium]|nr:S9 family peptidase [bacterium]